MEPKRNLQGSGHVFCRQIMRPLDLCSSANPELMRFSTSWSHHCPKKVALARPSLFLLLAFFILSSSAFSQLPVRPETGTLIKDVARSGYGVLTIHNNWTMDTVAVLTDKNVTPLIAVYIRSKAAYKIEKIEDGSYGLYFTIGNLWDEKARMFKSVLGYYRYNPLLVFQTNETDTDIEYSVFELDLYEADASNFVQDYFEFPDLR
jgi:hypothetical protein